MSTRSCVILLDGKQIIDTTEERAIEAYRSLSGASFLNDPLAKPRHGDYDSYIANMAYMLDTPIKKGMYLALHEKTHGIVSNKAMLSTFLDLINDDRVEAAA